jgi:hypothetical protein
LNVRAVADIRHVMNSSAPWLHVLLYQNPPGTWVARSLEHDIAVDGRTTDEATDQLLQIVSAHAEFDRRHGRHPLSAFPEAPQRYWAAFGTATPLRTVVCGRHGRTDITGRPIAIAVTTEPLPFRSTLAPTLPPPPRVSPASRRPAATH